MTVPTKHQKGGRERIELAASGAERGPKHSRAVVIRNLVPEVSDPMAALLENAFIESAPLKAVPTLSRRRRGGATAGLDSAPDDCQFRPGDVLDGLSGRYQVRGVVRKGEHCETYLAIVTDSTAPGRVLGERVIIKCPRVPVDMSEAAAADRLATLGALFHRDSETLKRLDEVLGVARFIDRGKYQHSIRDAVRSSVFVAQQYVAGKDLREYMDASAPSGRFRGISSAGEFFRWARTLASIVHEMHRRLVVHGCICPDNIRVNEEGKPVLVDFGEALFAQVIGEVAGLAGPGERYRSPERRRDVGDDIFSLGGVLLYLAGGEDPPRAYEDIEALKQQIKLVIRQNNPQLLDSACGVADVISRALRFSASGRTESAALLLADIELFDSTSVSVDIVKEVAQLQNSAVELQKKAPHLLRWAAVLKARELVSLFGEMASGVYDVGGDPNAIRGTAASLMSALVRGDKFVSISIPQFWAPENMGIQGRFMSKTREAIERGVIVQRVFLLDERMDDPHLKEIVAAHQAIAVDLNYPSNFGARYLQISKAEREHFVRSGKHFGLFLCDGSPTAMFPGYRPNGSLQSLRFRVEPAIVEGLRRLFEREYDRAMPLADLTFPVADVG